MEGMDPKAFVLGCSAIGAGLAMIAGVGPGIGLGFCSEVKVTGGWQVVSQRLEVQLLQLCFLVVPLQNQQVFTVWLSHLFFYLLTHLLVSYKRNIARLFMTIVEKTTLKGGNILGLRLCNYTESADCHSGYNSAYKYSYPLFYIE